MNAESEKVWEHIKGDYTETSPFTFKGRLHAGHYFLYNVLFNLIGMCCTWFFDNNISDIKIIIVAFILSVIVVILNLSVVKRRIYDFTLSNKKAWIYAVSFFVTVFILEIIYEGLQYILLPVGLIIWVLPSNKLTIDEYNKIQKEKNSISVIY